MVIHGNCYVNMSQHSVAAFNAKTNKPCLNHAKECHTKSQQRPTLRQELEPGQLIALPRIGAGKSLASSGEPVFVSFIQLSRQRQLYFILNASQRFANEKVNCVGAAHSYLHHFTPVESKPCSTVPHVDPPYVMVLGACHATIKPEQTSLHRLASFGIVHWSAFIT